MNQAMIVAIGGGRSYVPCGIPETFTIDQEIVRLAVSQNRRTPRVLFIPTASGDDIDYCNGIYSIYHLRLKCEYDYLRIVADSLSYPQIRDKIAWADVVYVGGGNTIAMMEIWRKHGVDKLLVEAYEHGIVMAGLSAGAICWFDWGLSDSLKFSHPTNWKPVPVRGLGLLPFGCSPHHDSEGWRRLAFEKAVKECRGLGVTIEDNCAFEVVGNRFRFIESQPNKGGSFLRWIPPENLARYPFLFNGRRRYHTLEEVCPRS